MMQLITWITPSRHISCCVALLLLLFICLHSTHCCSQLFKMFVDKLKFISSTPTLFSPMLPFAAGNVAVVTGASSGIGKAAALTFARLGMSVVLADIDRTELATAVQDVKAVSSNADNVIGVYTDVSLESSNNDLKDAAYAKFGKVNVFMANAGIQLPNSGVTGPAVNWERTIAVNMWGVVYGCQSFYPAMKAQGEPGALIITGSKQGITSPPGNLAYNMSKAAVKAFAEGLQHEIRQEADSKLQSYLLIPGWVNTSIARKPMRDAAVAKGEEFDTNTVFFHENKPAAGAWMPEQVLDYMFDQIRKNRFYIICPDNDVDSATDKARMKWSTADIIQDRPPLSRWHPAYAEEFAEFMKNETKK
jgi:NAD(P)-dependent dehydrogenase (short-subunit alcohol dehydrogenase family)